MVRTSVETAMTKGHRLVARLAVGTKSSKYKITSTAFTLVVFLAGSGAWLVLTAKQNAQEKHRRTKYRDEFGLPKEYTHFPVSSY